MQSYFMNHIKLMSLLMPMMLFFTNITNAQFIKGELTLVGCEDAEDPEMCFKEKVGQMYKEKLTDEIIDLMLETEKQVDTLNIAISFVVNEKGKVSKKMFYSDYSKNKKIQDFLANLLHENTLFTMPISKYGQPVITNKESVSFSYLLEGNEGERKLTLLANDEEKKDVMEVIEVAPIHRKCKRLTSNKALKKCFSTQVKQHVNKKFNTSILNTLKIKKSIIRMYVKFKIDKEGKIVDVVALGPYKELEEEAIRVVKKIPKLKPGTQRGKPVGVLYALPIMLAVGDN